MKTVQKAKSELDVTWLNIGINMFNKNANRNPYYTFKRSENLSL